MDTNLTAGAAHLARAVRDADEGQALVEYGLIVAFIAAVVVSSVVLFGVDVKDQFDGILGKF